MLSGNTGLFSSSSSAASRSSFPGTPRTSSPLVSRTNLGISPVLISKGLTIFADVNLPIYAVLYGGWKIYKKTKIVSGPRPR